MVPQRPYNAIGTLGEQLTYPESPDLTDPKVVALLVRASLLLILLFIYLLGGDSCRGAHADSAVCALLPGIRLWPSGVNRCLHSDPVLRSRPLQAELLDRVGLSYLVAREKGWNATANWVDVLSLGEQQRLGTLDFFFWFFLVFGFNCTNLRC